MQFLLTIYHCTTGVMAARGILNNPAMFAGYQSTPLQCVTDWVSHRDHWSVSGLLQNLGYCVVHSKLPEKIWIHTLQEE